MGCFFACVIERGLDGLSGFSQIFLDKHAFTKESVKFFSISLISVPLNAQSISLNLDLRARSEVCYFPFSKHLLAQRAPVSL